GHQRDRIVRDQRDGQAVEIRQCPEGGTGEQGGATMRRGRDDGGDGAAKDDLAEGIHAAILAAASGIPHAARGTSCGTSRNVGATSASTLPVCDNRHSVPSASSLNAVRLSTQSPSLA